MNDKDFDSSWKAVIDKFTAEFFEFYFYDLYSMIDFTKPVEFMDKELQKIFSRSKSGLKVADKLIKVKLKSGVDKIVFIHIEVQGEHQTDFAKRMMWYNFRIRDKYDNDVLSVALLTGKEANINNRFNFEMSGFSLNFVFPVVRITDFKSIENELFNSDNPFALLTLAQLRSIDAGYKDSAFDWKLKLFKILLKKYDDYEYTRVMLNFIDWIFVLPEDLDEKFIDEIHRIKKEEKNTMGHVNIIERKAMEKGEEKGIEKGENYKAERVAIKMLKDGENIEKIAYYLELPIDKIEKLREKLGKGEKIVYNKLCNTKNI